MNIHVFVVLMFKSLKELFCLLSPPPLPYRCADQVRRRKEQDAAGSKISELRHTDECNVSAFSVLVFSMNGLIVDQLVSCTC